MRRRDFIAVLGGTAAALPLNAPAQERVPEIGYLNFSSPATHPDYLSGFRRGLSRIDRRWSTGRGDHGDLPADEISRKFR